MIVSDSDATKRLESPLNLINRLKKATKPSVAMELFTGPRPGSQQSAVFNPFAKREVMPFASDELSVPKLPATNDVYVNAGEQHPAENTVTLDSILSNSDSQIKLGLAHDKSLSLLAKAVDILDSKLDDISPAKLPQTILAASKVVESIRRERTEASKNSRDREVHYHFYTPEQKKIESYEVIEVQ